MRLKLVYTCLGIAVILVGWGIAWANQNAKISENKAQIETLSKQIQTVSSQASESEKAIVRMETKIEYILKGIDEIKAEVKAKK
jgi:septal ring factor EnvC (AmiA/AmiB activator)